MPNLETSEGKLHPGPRASLEYDVMEDATTVVFWVEKTQRRNELEMSGSLGWNEG